ncbi:MAG: hypothetical protein RL300_1002 [Pseudomonadota bacterium]|jgi:hypothetical protein
MVTRPQVFAPWLAALWWGSLTTLGALVVPLLFVYLPSPAMAGSMAAKLFSAQTWLSVVCGLLLLLLQRPGQAEADSERAQSALVFLLLGVLLALLSEFAIAPRIVSRENLRFWHSAGSVIFVLQWLCAGVTFWKVTRHVVGSTSVDLAD